MADDYLDADDLAEIELAMAEEDAAAVGVLRAALGDRVGGPPPTAELAAAEGVLRAGLIAGDPDYEYFASATGWNGDLPEDPEDLWVEALLSIVVPEDASGWPEEQQAQLDSLTHADWVGATIGLVRAGPGADASPAALVDYVATCPELDGDLDEDNRSYVQGAFLLVLPLWAALGVVDSERRLTALGAWALPMALELAWSLSDEFEQDAAAEEQFRSELLAALTPEAGADLDREALVRLAKLAGEERIVTIARTEVNYDPAWEPFLHRLLAATDGTHAAAGPAYLLAARAEWVGDVAEQERWLAAALAADPGYVEALFDSADLAGDRGDARTAKALLERAGADYDDPDLATYRAALAPNASTPRNAPCPCGSGRKFKLCHGAESGQTLSDRAGWLFSKVIGFVTRPAQREALQPWVDARAPGGWQDEDAALHDLLMYDAAIFDGELLDRFLTVRGPLLPADERELAETWRASSRSVYEVDSVRPGVGVTLRDLVNGDAVDLRERGASRQLAAGSTLVARLLDTGAGPMFGLAMPVPEHHRDGVLTALKEAAEPAEFLAWITRAEVGDVSS